jgi:hypothetical protein
MEGRGRIDLQTAIDQWGRNVGNRHLSERQIVKLCERFGQDYAMLRRHEGDDLGWDAQDERREGVKLLCRGQDEMSLKL